ncbi:hypothetical protein P7A61_05300 [Clostridium perfringens]|nr:hypothetical protein [Clostridium perfringens]
MNLLVKNMVAVGASELVKAIVNQYISPIFKKDYENGQKKREETLFEDKISEYLERSYKKNEYINTIIFKNQQKKLDDIYIPLTVIKNTENTEVENEGIIIDKYSENFIPLYNKVLLVDNAGMGKSTIVKYLYLSAIRENKGIPILIELRKLKKGMRIIDFIISEVNGIKDDCKKELLLELIDGGDFIFFLDGYDEIIPEDKIDITNDIQNFISKAYKNKFIISSRDERELYSFGDFQRFDIKPLSKEEAYELIRKYDNDGVISNSLIENLERNDNFEILSEFLANPLMVSLLYKSFDYKRVISYEKHIFYRQVYDALYENHDLSKSGGYSHTKKSGLNIDEFHRILRYIGFLTLNKSISYTRDELLEVIDKAKYRNLNLSFQSSDFLWDLVHSVSLFMIDGIEFKWVHKSFQEYFAAEYISRDSKELQEKMLIKISREENIEKYYNVLDFCYDIDYKSFVKFIIYPIIKEYEMFFNREMQNGDLEIEDVKERKELEFSLRDIFIKKANFDDIVNNPNEEKFYEVFGEKINNNIINIILGCGLAVSLGKRRYNSLLKLLLSKNSELIKYSNKNGFDLYSSIVFEIKDEIKENTWVKLNSDVSNHLNSRENFKRVNEFIKTVVNNYSDKSITLIFDFDKCMKLKKDIERNLYKEESDLDFL